MKKFEDGLIRALVGEKRGPSMKADTGNMELHQLLCTEEGEKNEGWMGGWVYCSCTERFRVAVPSVLFRATLSPIRRRS